MLIYLFIKLNTFLIYASYRLSPCKVMVLLWSCCAVISEKVRTSRLTWTSAWDAPAWGGWLARARLIDSPPARLLTSARDLFLKPFPSIELFSLLLALPSLAATTGRAAAPFATSSPSALPATSILQVCPPLPFPSAVRDGAPPNPNKTIVFGSESSYNVLPANLDFVCKNYRVYMCTPVSYAGSAPVQFFDLAIHLLRGGVLNPIYFLNFFWGSAPRQLRPF